MEAVLTNARWTQKAQVLAGTLSIAIVINLVLLLLIASLVNCKDTEHDPLPQLRPVDFIRLPKPKPKPPEKKIIEKPVEPPKPKEEPKPPPKKIVKPVKKARPKRPTPKVAAPKLDIPLDGSGSAFESVAGKDSRLTAPPTKWDVKQEPVQRKGPVTRRLVALSRVMPVYPWRAKAMGVEGWVKVEIIVDTVGNVSRVTVVDDKPKNMFGQAAITAIKKWRFKPAFIDGEAVEQRAVQLMEFRLRN